MFRTVVSSAEWRKLTVLLRKERAEGAVPQRQRLVRAQAQHGLHVRRREGVPLHMGLQALRCPRHRAVDELGHAELGRDDIEVGVRACPATGVWVS
jgi:hypothetical protein